MCAAAIPTGCSWRRTRAERRSESGPMTFHRLRSFLTMQRRLAPVLCAALALAGLRGRPSGGGRPVPAAKPVPSTPRPTLPAPTPAPSPTPTPGATPAPAGPPPAIAAGLVPGPALDTLPAARCAAHRAGAAGLQGVLRIAAAPGGRQRPHPRRRLAASVQRSGKLARGRRPQFLPALFRGGPARRRQDPM